jgi:hypothetical protein
MLVIVWIVHSNLIQFVSKRELMKWPSYLGSM